MGSNINLNLKPSSFPKTIGSLLNDLSKVDNESGKLSMLKYYLLKYEQESAIVEAFKSELPTCKSLLADAIETLKEEIDNIHANLKEPETEKSRKRKHCENEQMVFLDDRRRNLMIDMNSPPESDPPELRNPTQDQKKQKAIIRSSQAINGTPIQSCIKDMKRIASDGSCSFSFKRTFENQRTEVTTNNSDLNSRMGPTTLGYHRNSMTEQKSQQNRRPWTQEINARFLHALNILRERGALATPNQIRDMIQVEGLTTDEVKSHLQILEGQCDVTYHYKENDDERAFYQP